jgi:hypothetical protein
MSSGYVVETQHIRLDLRFNLWHNGRVQERTSRVAVAHEHANEQERGTALMSTQQRKELRRITETSGDCVLATEGMGEIWVDIERSLEQEFELAKELGGSLFSSLSTDRMRRLGFNGVYRTTNTKDGERAS